MPTKPRREGYLLIDHRNSPGIPHAMVAKSLEKCPIVAAGQIYESPTNTCAHCGCVVILNPSRDRPRGYCRLCDHYVCDNPACNSECNPLVRRFDTQQELAFRDELSGKTMELLKHG